MATDAESVSIRECRPEDVPAVLDLWHQAGATPTATDTPADLAQVLAARTTAVLVGVAGGRVIGSLIGTFDGWRGNLYRLAVHPEYRRRGVARALLAAVEKRLAALGARRVTALVERDHPPAMAFWEAAGYGVDGRMVRCVRVL